MLIYAVTFTFSMFLWILQLAKGDSQRKAVFCTLAHFLTWAIATWMHTTI